MNQPERHAVYIVPHDSQWPVRAKYEADRLVTALGNNLLKVEHIGSTSVAGLAAKPVIDLLPIVKSIDALDKQSALIKALGYIWHGEFGIAGRRFCTLTNAAGIREVHVHCFEYTSPQIRRHLAFRDYLRAHPEIAKAYEAEKQRAALLHPHDSFEYNFEKGAWVQRYEAKALAWFEQQAPS